MHRFILLGIGAALVAAAGCSGDDGSGRGLQAAEPLAFDPGLHLKWPGTPRADSHVLPANGGEQKDYAASYGQKWPSGLLLYQANVIERPAKALEGLTPKDMFTIFVPKVAGEISRQEIEFGPHRHPGLDLLAKQDGRFQHARVVMAGRRLYIIAVSSPDQKALDNSDVRDFFESFTLD